MPGVIVDGMDVESVYDAASKAVARARGGDGPTLIECKTYRYRGHSRGDPGGYRSAEEHAEWTARDPIERTQGQADRAISALPPIGWPTSSGVRSKGSRRRWRSRLPAPSRSRRTAATHVFAD